jgi:hypothetical protein
MGRKSSQPSVEPVIDRVQVEQRQLAALIDTLRRLARGLPAEQAEIATLARDQAQQSTSPYDDLRYALVLATPGHGASNAALAEQSLRALLASPLGLSDLEQGLAAMELQRLQREAALRAENRSLNSSDRAERERVAALNRRLQSELEENARLRKALEEVRAKLDAIMNIERSVTEGRKP